MQHMSINKRPPERKDYHCEFRHVLLIRATLAIVGGSVFMCIKLAFPLILGGRGFLQMQDLFRGCPYSDYIIRFFAPQMVVCFRLGNCRHVGSIQTFQPCSMIELYGNRMDGPCASVEICFGSDVWKTILKRKR
ncbi:hypothetical protein CEXT_254741 [Caerostris extrusa]|uniref:Uncharacterized protein n=1 Tax=Caerostris extrusa TaxID=172846 RepID=A0AAV4PX81_CAEEX|nr:hypothetical protein CEXT_254741 [Caerostris extrusa]